MPKGFRFGLEKLLEIRGKQEEESKRKFTQSQRETKKTEIKLNDLNDNYKKYNGINKGETLVYQKIKKNYLFALNKGIDETEKELKLRERELDFRREDLKKKQIERKTVDILKENQLSAYNKEQNRIEQINNDEFALYAYMRNQAASKKIIELSKGMEVKNI
ncbi:flagellar export protein FliJ [Clostridium gasigenes]|uniref:flagellar export protein FliJ n=1 Tax=Clostridium gasigenes TaxID=94869 RepID=UPI001C0ABBA9|nr:flagellar export protein FliJ [Clostridium gasigenes]MBU3109443.1 flagellar export protein FliJ [Clostridium gasigenes]